ncbi:MAG: MaoC family dehydratase [Dehalococcoidia bacterium]
MSFGRYFEDFTVGEIIRHWPGRTITEADDTWFALLTQNQHPLHIDAHYASQHTQHGQRLVVGTLVFAIAVGQTVADVSGRAIANLEYERVTHDAPTFHGDTIYTNSTVLEANETSKGDRGVIYVETVATNQRDEKVMTFRRRVLVPKRSHPTLGEGKLPY